MKESQNREERAPQRVRQANAGASEPTGRVYRSGHGGERRIGRLTQTVYGEGEVTESVRRTKAQQSHGNIEIEAEQEEKQKRMRKEAQKVQQPEARPNRKRADEARTQQPESGGWKEKMKKRKQKRARIVLTGVLGVAAAAYIAVAVYFGFHFYEGTEIYGIDCSQLTVEEVKQEVAQKLDQYVLTIQERSGQEETISAQQIGLTFVDNNSIDRMLRAQRSYIWPVMMLLEQDPVVSVAFQYDEQRVKETLNQMKCFDTLHTIAPKDAYILTTEDGFVVEKEIMGTRLDQNKTLRTVLDALDAGKKEVSLEENDCYINPTVLSDDEEIQQEAEAKNALVQANITYDFGTAQETVNALVIQNWITQLEDGSYVIDDSYVYDYVEQMAAKYDTFGLPVTFYTSLGTTETLSGGDYGWCIDQDQTVLELLQALDSGYQGTMEPVYLYTGMSHENNGIGYTYVEICISQQRMWCYENGYCIVDTPVVTGNPNKGNGTPSGGVWAIDAKKRDAILEGEGYAAPVDYWMPFNGDIGIHDLKERAYFGSTIYLTNGSHGCVNTPYEAVQTIYNTVSIGTPVIVYE